MAVALLEWERNVLPYINGAPTPALEDAVRLSAIEFCQKTRVDTRTWKELPYLSAEPDVVIPQPDFRVIACEALNVWTKTGGWVRPRTRPEIDLKYGSAAWVSQESDTFEDVWGWISLRPYLVRLIPAITIDSTDELSIEAAMQPKADAAALEDFLYDIHSERIAWGALARLHAHVNAPYANPALVQGFRMAFDAAISEVQHRQEAGSNRPLLRTMGDRLA